MNAAQFIEMCRKILRINPRQPHATYEKRVLKLLKAPFNNIYIFYAERINQSTKERSSFPAIEQGEFRRDPNDQIILTRRGDPDSLTKVRRPTDRRLVQYNRSYATVVLHEVLHGMHMHLKLAPAPAPVGGDNYILEELKYRTSEKERYNWAFTLAVVARNEYGRKGLKSFDARIKRTMKCAKDYIATRGMPSLVGPSGGTLTIRAVDSFIARAYLVSEGMSLGTYAETFPDGRYSVYVNGFERLYVLVALFSHLVTDKDDAQHLLDMRRRVGIWYVELYGTSRVRKKNFKRWEHYTQLRSSITPGTNDSRSEHCDTPKSEASEKMKTVQAKKPWRKSKRRKKKINRLKRSPYASDYLVHGDSTDPTTWHLPVKERGKPNRKLMGFAWSLLHRKATGKAKRYSGPDRATAIQRLKQLYRSLGVPTPTKASHDTTEGLPMIRIEVVPQPTPEVDQSPPDIEVVHPPSYTPPGDETPGDDPLEYIEKVDTLTPQAIPKVAPGASPIQDPTPNGGTIRICPHCGRTVRNRDLVEHQSQIYHKPCIQHGPVSE